MHATQHIGRRRQRWEGRAPAISAAAALLFAVPFVVGSTNFCLDDAWIHLSYAKSLRLGEGLSYNPNDGETGFSSPLWVLVLSLWPTGPDPTISVKGLGSVLHAACAWTACALAMEMAHARATPGRSDAAFRIGLLGGLLVAAHPKLLQASTSGMEVSLAALLILATIRAQHRRAWLVASGLAFASVLARPEALFLWLPMSLSWALNERSRRPTACAFTGAAALGLWALYCVTTTGWPWPNTHYVKAGPGGVQGLLYLRNEVLIGQPWFVSLTGVVLLGLAFRDAPAPSAKHRSEPSVQNRSAKQNRRAVAIMLGSWAISMVAVALSRPLHEGVLFYESRYFTIFAAIPLILIALGIARCSRALTFCLVLPIAVVGTLQYTQTLARQRDQEQDITLLHRDPAQFVASHLPPDTVLAVEGAGAFRFFTPRSFTIIDVLGLNDSIIAHLATPQAKICEIWRRSPTHFAVPEAMALTLGTAFDFRLIRRFSDPHYAQVRHHHPQDLVLLEVLGLRGSWPARCAVMTSLSP